MGLSSAIRFDQIPNRNSARRIYPSFWRIFALMRAKSCCSRVDIHLMGTSPHDSSASDQARLVSEFASETEMAELIEYFLAELKDRIGGLEHAFSVGDHERLRQLAHQLKGAAGGYGYPSITNSAAELEFTLTAEQAAISSIAEKVEGLILLCKRATGGS